MHTLALTGKSGGVLKSLADFALVVPSEVTAHIQECHIVVGHLLCDGIEQGLELA
jgi:D-sedoheptulose 7-phosphate isomerase